MQQYDLSTQEASAEVYLSLWTYEWLCKVQVCNQRVAEHLLDSESYQFRVR